MRPINDPVHAFVDELLRCGLVVTDVLAVLLEDLPDDAFPGESNVEVLMEMLVGSIRPAADAAGAPALRQATALLGAVSDRVVEDLRAALDAASG